MAIKFFNIRSGESRLAETEPHIAALWGSSDRSPNVSQGQDFGWRLAPETVVEIDRIKDNPREIESIAVQFGLLPDSVTESDILTYISGRENQENQGINRTQEDFKEEYEDEIRRLRKTGQIDSAASIKHEEPKPEQPSKPAELDGEVNPDLQTRAEEGPPADESEASSQPEPEQESDTPDEEDIPEGKVNQSMSRAQLEATAKSVGVDAPSSFQNKDQLIEAIKAKQSE